MSRKLAEGSKNDSEKPRLDLLPVRPIIAAGRVMLFGAKKYAERNWEHGLKYGRLYRACLAHLFAWWGGEENDPETGESHLSHAVCCILMLHEMTRIHPELDDRPDK